MALSLSLRDISRSSATPNAAGSAALRGVGRVLPTPVSSLRYAESIAFGYDIRTEAHASMRAAIRATRTASMPPLVLSPSYSISPSTSFSSSSSSSSSRESADAFSVSELSVLPSQLPMSPRASSAISSQSVVVAPPAAVAHCNPPPSWIDASSISLSPLAPPCAATFAPVLGGELDGSLPTSSRPTLFTPPPVAPSLSSSPSPPPPPAAVEYSATLAYVDSVLSGRNGAFRLSPTASRSAHPPSAAAEPIPTIVAAAAETPAPTADSPLQPPPPLPALSPLSAQIVAAAFGPVSELMMPSSVPPPPPPLLLLLLPPPATAFVPVQATLISSTAGNESSPAVAAAASPTDESPRLASPVVKQEVVEACVDSSANAKVAASTPTGTFIVDASAYNLPMSRTCEIDYVMYGEDFAMALARGAVRSGHYAVARVGFDDADADAEDDGDDQGPRKKKRKEASRKPRKKKEAAPKSEAEGWVCVKIDRVDSADRTATVYAAVYDYDGSTSTSTSGGGSGEAKVGTSGDDARKLVNVRGDGQPMALEVASLQWHLGDRHPATDAECRRLAAGLYFEYARDLDTSRYYHCREHRSHESPSSSPSPPPPPDVCDERGRVRVSAQWWRKRVPRGYKSLDRTLAQPV